jgi:hypothetical protein
VTGKARYGARGAITAVAALFAVTLSGGCGISTVASTFNGGLFGGSKQPETTQKVSESNLLTAAQNDAGKQVDLTAADGECPTMVVAPGDNNITFMAKGGTDSLAVMHRGEITKTARECAPSISGGLSVKFGFAGRVLLGPQGKPGTVTLPVKVTLVDANQNAIRSDVVKVPVTITPDQAAGYFSVTREVVVPVPQGASARNYRIIVAFDRRAPGAS